MATISELVVKIVADTAGLDKGINDATKSIDGVGKASKDADGKAAGLSSQFGALKGALVSAGLIAAFVAVGKAIADSVQAFGEAEMAAKRLDAIATMNGLADGSERVQALANELQNLIGVDGDLVVQLGAELIAQGKSVEQTEELIRAANDLSAVTGGDLQTSVKQLTATYSGTSGRLGQLIPEFKDLTEEQLKNGDAIDIINEKYGGMAASLSDSVIPATNRLKEANNDLKETFGKAFAPLWIQIADGIAAALRGILVPLDYMATHSFDRMFQEIAESLFNFKGEATLAEEAQAALNDATIEAYRAAISYNTGVKNLKTELDKLTGSTDKLTDAELENARSFLFAQMKKSSSMDALTQAQKKLDIFDKEISDRKKERDKKTADEAKKTAEQLAADLLKTKQENLDDMESAFRASAAEEVKIWAAENEAQKLKEKETAAYVIAKEDEVSKAKADAYGDSIAGAAKEAEAKIAEAKREAAERTRINNELYTLLRSSMSTLSSLSTMMTNNEIAEINAETQAKLEAAGLQEQTTIEKLTAEKDAAILAGDEELAAKKQQEIDRQVIIDDGIKKTAQAQYKGALAQWTLSLATTVADSISAVVKSMASLPWPANLIPAGIQTGLGIAQVNAFRGAKPKAPALARGSDFTQGGTTLVGEEGPELVNMPRGASVTPNSRGGTGGGNTFIINSPVAVTPSVAAQEYTRMVRNLAFEGVL